MFVVIEKDLVKNVVVIEKDLARLPNGILQKKKKSMFLFFCTQPYQQT